MFPDFSELKYKLQRKAALLAEDFDIFKYINKQPIEVMSEPFPHIVVDNFFKEEFVSRLENYYSELLKKGQFKALGGYGDKFTVDLCTPTPVDNEIVSIFYSLGWNNFFAEIFKKKTEFLTLFTFHHHKEGDKNSHVHTDFVHDIFSKSNKLPNGVTYLKRRLTPLEIQNGDTVKGVRIIALVYHLFNKEWKRENGGRTFLYKVPDEVSKSLFSNSLEQTKQQKKIDLYHKIQKGDPVKEIEPIRNRLLAFEVLPYGYHAVEGNNIPRSSITQWFYGNYKNITDAYGEDIFI